MTGRNNKPKPYTDKAVTEGHCQKSREPGKSQTQVSSSLRPHVMNEFSSVTLFESSFTHRNS